MFERSMIKDVAECVGRARMALLLVVETACVVLQVSVALFLSALIDAAMRAVETGDGGPLVRAALASCAYALVTGCVIIASERAKAGVVRRVMLGLRGRAARGLLAGGAAAADGAEGQNSADALTLLGQNMDALEASGVKNALEMFDLCVQMMVACVMLLAINPLVGAVSLVATAVPTLIPRLFSRKLTMVRERITDATSTYNARVRDMAQGAEVVRTFGVGPAQEALHGEAVSELEGQKARLAETMGLVTGTATTAAYAIQLSIMALTGWFAVLGLVSVGSIVAVTQLAGEVIGPAFELSEKLSGLRSVRPIVERVEAVAEARLSGSEPVPVRETLELRDVTFAYPGSGPVVRDVSARFEAGGKYALVGPSGCGKSTLLRLLAGQLAPASGEVAVDGRAGAAPDAAFIHQNVFLFDDTLRNNITLWDEFSDRDVMQAVRAAGLSDVVAGLPQGLDMPVGENGARLSGGERQRVAIARALLHKKGVLLVDEATSALDAAMAAQVEDVLLGLEGVAVVEVTHRLDAARAERYDAVLELRDGRLAPAAVDTGAR